MTLPLQSDLKRYCLAKAGSAWDADDLLQESLIKAYRWYTRRKWEPQVGPLEEHLIGSYDEWSKWDVREALELLSDRLEPKQVVLILLIDVFHFTAKETGRLFGQSEGSVKAALRRARTRLKKTVESHPEYWDDSVLAAPRGGLSIEVFEALVEGFRRADPYAIFRSYQTLIDDGAVVDRIELRGNTLYFTIIDPDGNVLTITEKLKWQDDNIIRKPRGDCVARNAAATIRLDPIR
ncbi:hypothetical protein BGX30_004166 [Mortierella sp. GBA39]|nr:hypothetical protein BGX30_004166 [Mortierella sp. GBA39]